MILLVVSCIKNLSKKFSYMQPVYYNNYIIKPINFYGDIATQYNNKIP